jgi:hypothetical protein
MNEITPVARAIWDFLNTVLGASITGSTVAVFLFMTLTKSSIDGMLTLNFNKQLEEYRSTLSSELERFKLSLKYAETFFAREFKALTELRELKNRIIPRQYHREMTWEDACEFIAVSFEQHEDELAKFVAHYEVVLPSEVVTKLKTALGHASEGKFEVQHIQGIPRGYNRRK